MVKLVKLSKLADEKSAKIRRSICRLDYQEFCALESWMRKRRDKMWVIERAKRKREHEESIKTLPEGTEVVFTDSRHEFCAKVGKIKRHLERGSIRTVVDFGKEIGIWHVPRQQLSANVSEENIKQLKSCKYIGSVLSKALSKIK